ncbi:type I secretion outer membrane protein, TolC family [Desulfocapsa sulfexigens DSM 10523]|uniref:Type I secretion outer membrane protein, TolC family n=1 Tax=Desulfocapsa sulfexigens (strain DSM 10523 / SB164P1) TaxID=1167006 RepID=M1P482_DESSD|nr:TolC family outer membrane protein [Desulfocapsa sulfexigens]AGF78298.1 type I secretion outer membrane protein, TolC family [Desulfocapsa sulfexigens DSM 10523]
MKVTKLLSSTLIGGVLLFDGSSLPAETLQDAIDTMLQTNPEIRSMAHNRLGRDQEVKQARSGYLPELNFIAGVGVADYQEPESDTGNPEQYTLSLRQNIFTGLATINEVERQEARVRSQAYSLQGASENMALRTTEVYLNVLRQQELERLSQENLDTHVRIADQINLRSESGVASKSDSDQVSGRLALAQANVVATKTNVLDAQTNFFAVVGHLPTDLQEPVSPESLIPATLEDAESEAIKMHPTLKSAGADLEAREKQYEVAKAPYWPIIDLEVDQTWENDYTSATEGKMDSLTAMIKLRYNFFRGFKDEARRAETVELVSEAREIRNNTHRQVVQSMKLSWMAYQAAKDQINYLEQRVDFATGTADAYTKQFNLGKRTLLDVLDSEAEVIDAKRALVEARYDGLYAQYRILNGLGQLVKSFDKEWPEESQVSIGPLVVSEKQ